MLPPADGPPVPKSFCLGNPSPARGAGRRNGAPAGGPLQPLERRAEATDQQGRQGTGQQAVPPSRHRGTDPRRLRRYRGQHVDGPSRHHPPGSHPPDVHHHTGKHVQGVGAVREPPLHQYWSTARTFSPCSLSRPLSPTSSISTATPWTSPPSCLTRSTVARAVPPVASRSSTISTFCPFSIASLCISRQSVPY